MPSIISRTPFIREPTCFTDNKFFPDNDLGRILNTLVYQFKIKQEPRNGWARKNACDPPQTHPCESVASHMWGVAYLVMVISKHPDFPVANFQLDKALEMAILHDLAEVTIGDITPVDGVSIDVKHKSELKAMGDMLDTMPDPIKMRFQKTYEGYENKSCDEAKFVKDCDRLDFILTAFLLERQGFSGYPEFYTNSMQQPFFVPLVKKLADMVCSARELLNYEI